MKSPYISIVIPTLNEEKYLPLLLKDLSNQTEPNFEVIVIDGNSDDNTLSACEIFKSDLKLSLVKVNKRNVSYQRNYGAKHARGDYILFLDADVRISHGFIKSAYRVINKSKHLIILFPLLPQSKDSKDYLVFKAANNIVLLSQLTNKPLSNGGNMMFYKPYFQHLGGFNPKLFLAEDHDIIQRARNGGVTVKIVHRVYLRQSLRRIKHEGWLRSLTKYGISTIHYFQKGKIDHKIIEYNMGGANYQLTNGQRKDTISKLNDYIQKVKSTLQSF